MIVVRIEGPQQCVKCGQKASDKQYFSPCHSHRISNCHLENQARKQRQTEKLLQYFSSLHQPVPLQL